MLTLVRYALTEVETIGHLFKDGEYFCDTLELPWRNNEHYVSCIPEGVYSIKLRNNEEAHIKHGYLLENVPDRDGILIHSANAVDQLQGCIAVGVKSLSLVYNSREILYKLIEVVGDADTLTIKRIQL